MMFSFLSFFYVVFYIFLVFFFFSDFLVTHLGWPPYLLASYAALHVSTVLCSAPPHPLVENIFFYYQILQMLNDPNNGVREAAISCIEVSGMNPCIILLVQFNWSEVLLYFSSFILLHNFSDEQNILFNTKKLQSHIILEKRKWCPKIMEEISERQMPNMIRGGNNSLDIVTWRIWFILMIYTIVVIYESSISTILLLFSVNWTVQPWAKRRKCRNKQGVCLLCN